MPRSSIALMLLLIGCMESAANVTYVTVEEMNAAEPRVPADAVVSSTKLANKFLAICFDSFPNFEEANLAMRREGFGPPDS
ncbi:MAG TPA: hypothetical protein EYG79_02185, partial [Rhodobacteraceae bacterium]|nr:hypothetical protein [Paracoccaceae bacterium]